MKKWNLSRHTFIKAWVLLAIVIFGILEVTILDYFKILGVKPDLFLIYVVMVSLIYTFELQWALFLSVFSGMLKDILATSAFGINTLLFPLWSLLIIKLSRNILIENNFIYAALVLIISIFNNIIIRLINLNLGNFIPLVVFLRITFLESFYTALILPLVFKLNQRLVNYKKE